VLLFELRIHVLYYLSFVLSNDFGAAGHILILQAGLPLQSSANTGHLLDNIANLQPALADIQRSRASRPCRLFLGMLRTPDTIPTSSPTHIDIQVKQLPRTSTAGEGVVGGPEAGYRSEGDSHCCGFGLMMRGAG
jgi:hypothetical protein